MARDPRSLTDFEHVLLGNMAREAYSGYGLKRIFSTTPAMVYQPSPGALYPALRRLVSRGLLSVEDTVPPGGRPQRLYRATEEGRAAHQEWLRQPVDPATVANDLGLHLMRLAMMDENADREMARTFLAAWRAPLRPSSPAWSHTLPTGGTPPALRDPGGGARHRRAPREPRLGAVSPCRG